MPPGRTFSLSLPPFTKAVKWLVLINAGMLLLLTLLQAVDLELGRLVSTALSLVPYLVLHGWVFQLVTYSFLHQGFWHLAGNMLGLWMFGSQIESDWGIKRFLEFYFFCVVGAALTNIAVSYTGFGGVTPKVLQWC